MNGVVLLCGALVLFVAGYWTYLRRIAASFGLRNDRPTPAHAMRDNVDYCPAPMPVLLGHHFSTIAGAGPIVGPIVAAAYGWAPIFLWIIIGTVFIGAVHDFVALIASVRHNGRSIGEVVQECMGTGGRILFLLFSWSTLVLVVAIFALLVAKTFIESPPIVTSSLVYMLLAIVFGVLVYRWRCSFTWVTLAMLPLLLASIWLGVRFPLGTPHEGFLIVGVRITPFLFWIIVLSVYIFAASVAPVWLLLQPRDYLSSYLLYALMIGGVVGIVAERPTFKLPAFTAFTQPELGSMFPMLFVLVACGAVSGFHALVASGTSAKQINRETDARMIGFGAMLIEGVLAVIALITAARLSHTEYARMSANPIEIFAHGIGSCLTRVGLPEQHGLTFAALAVSAFVLTTLDSATRIARFCLQELFTIRRASDGVRVCLLDRYSATLICILAAGALALSGQATIIWPVFGAANQLLAALTLLTVTVWLLHLRRRALYTLIPACFMMAVTLTALVRLFMSNAAGARNALAGADAGGLPATFATQMTLACVTIVLFVLAVLLAVLAVRAFVQQRRRPGAVPSPAR